MTDEHPKSKLTVSDADKAKADRIAAKMLATFDKGCRQLQKLGGDEFAAHNFGVHLLLKVAANQAAYNAIRDGREPRADFWDTVCREALERANKQLSERMMAATVQMICRLDGDGNWHVARETVNAQ